MSSGYAAHALRDVKASERSLISQLTRQGLIVNPVDPAPFRSMLRSYYESWAPAFGPTAWGLLEASLERKLI